MAEHVYLGVDLGAESGRVMAGLWDGERMRLEELHRFPNGGVWVGDSLKWDVVRLWAEIQQGLGEAGRRFGGAVRSVGVDTWGVDSVLLSGSDELLGLPFHYRDPRTRGVMARVLQSIPREDIFAQTGLQFMEINTLFQWVSLKEQHPELLDAARCFLMMPDFFHWCLSGEKRAEFTNATTTQFYHPLKRDWARGLLERLQLPTGILPPVVDPGTVLGPLRTSLAQRAGLSGVRVIAPATHDTGSAVAAVPTESTGRSNWAYISSGTWSLMGVEIREALLTPRALASDLTNEGGIQGTYRLLKNIMGLWLVQQCKRSFERAGHTHSYEDLVTLASKAPALRSLVNPDAPEFLSPEDMPHALRERCRVTGEPVPEDEGAMIRCALESLALKYAVTLRGLEESTGVPVDVIHVVGGGSRNHLLNQFTADACQRPVLAGPVEATVLGNVLVQAQADGQIRDLPQLRSVVRQSGGIQRFEPRDQARWAGAYERFVRLLSLPPAR